MITPGESSIDGTAAVTVGASVIVVSTVVVSAGTTVVGASTVGVAGVVPVEPVVVGDDTVSVVASVVVLTAVVAWPEPEDWTDDEESLSEADADAADALLVARARAGPFARLELVELEFAEWPELPSDLPVECGVAPESDEPVSVLAAATP